MSYAKFSNLLFGQSLYFARLSALKDKYEGTLPYPNAAMGGAEIIGMAGLT